MRVVLCKMFGLTAHIAATADCSVSRLEGCSGVVVLVQTEEGRAGVVKCYVALTDRLAAERIVLAHAAEYDERVKVVHALIEGESGWCDALYPVMGVMERLI